MCNSTARIVCFNSVARPPDTLYAANSRLTGANRAGGNVVERRLLELLRLNDALQ